MTYFKRKPYRNRKLLDAAEGELCLYRGPTCMPNSGVVAYHSNPGEDGKGMRQKAGDDCTFYGCYGCHKFYDGQYTRLGYTKEEAQAMADRAIVRTMFRRRQQIESGELKL